MASGNISSEGSSIQTEAAPGAGVAAIVYAIPNFNRVLCVRLGQLSVQLDECDLVGLADRGDRSGGVVSSANIATRDWYAWNNTMQPKPDDFHVVGEVFVPNPGVEAILVPGNPQGFNPTILLLDLILVQRPGVWPQVCVWTTARYDKVNAHYSDVQIFFNNDVIANVSVDIVQ